MDYEKKYKEALERAKKFEEKYGGGYAEYIFPELAESEDERIRKELKEAFEAYDIESKWNGIPIRSIFAWLEKQKEPAIEAMADLERTFECNPDKLPGWLKDELTKRNIEGYIKGRNDALREMSDFMESHFNTKKAKEGEDLTDLYRKEYAQPIPSGWGCDGTHCTNPQMDCINCPIKIITTPNTASVTSEAISHGNTSVTDGKPHNPSFTD